LLELRGHGAWNWPDLDTWILLAHETIDGIDDLIGQRGLFDCARARRNQQRPEHGNKWRGDQAHGAYGGFIHPFLLTDHGDDAAIGTLQGQRQRGLQTDQRGQVATFLELDHDLVFIAELLGLIALRAKDIF
jgi:hypothetical protein